MPRIWKEEEIKTLILTNDRMVYKSLLKLYECQTADEQEDGSATERNGAGFNGIDAPILTSFAEFLNRAGFLTAKQTALCRKKLVKYTKQLTRIANSATA